MRANAGRLRNWALALGALAAMGAGPRGDEGRLADYFGFLPLEVYKLDTRITGLVVRDFRDDLALITKDEILLIFQREKGKLGEPERLPHTLGNPRMVKPVDLDGDGSDDLAMLDGGNDDPIRVRFATSAGKFGPEERFAVENLRAYAFGQVDGKPGSELLTIENQSGRVRVLSLASDDDDARRGRLSFNPLPPGGDQG